MRSHWRALAAIVAVFAVGCAIVHPLRDVPVIDDWVYAWCVEHLLRTGQLRVLELGSVYPVTQIGWGALFARLFGFSFGVLRLSTVVLAAIGCWAFYLTLVECRLDRRLALLGALALALDPVYFALAFSFMTDVPLVALSLVAIYWYVSAVERGRAGRFWVAGAWALIAFLVRPIAIVLPLSVVPVAAARAGWKGLRQAIAPVVVALAAMAGAGAVLPRIAGPLGWAAFRFEQLRWWFTIPALDYLTWNTGLILEALFPVAPLLLAALTSRRRLVPVAAVSLAFTAVALAITGHVASPLPHWETWSLQDIAARTMISGTLTPSAWSLRVTAILRVAGVVIVGVFVVALVRRLAAGSRGGAVLLWFGLAQVILINVLWLYNDRYYLVLVPTEIFVAASWLEARRATFAIAGVLLALWAFVAVSGTRDMLGVNATAAAIARQLEASGVPAWEIDAGYALNGWRLYAHPEHLPPGASPDADVPFVTSTRPTQYAVANRPMDGWQIVRIVPLPDALWQVTDRLYVLRNERDLPR